MNSAPNLMTDALRVDGSLAALLRCPKCKQEATLNSSNEAGYACKNCSTKYPIIAGVPRFVPPDNYAGSFGFQWARHARTQLDSHTGQPLSRNRLFAATEWPSTLPDELVLEAGCGAGRFTEVLLSTGAKVVSFDYSTAVEANHLNHGHDPRLLIFQGDIFEMPLRDAVFDKVVCLGVLQHTPNPSRAFRCLAEKVKPGGRLVVDLYYLGFSTSLHWKYLLRPITRRMDKERLYRLTQRAVDVLLPLSGVLRRALGRAGPRLLPIAEYSHLGLSAALAREWSVLDTFDMYSPAFDKPQTVQAVRKWYEACGFEEVSVRIGGNGVIARGTKSAS